MYRWQCDEHQVVFDSIEQVRLTNPEPLREQLPAHATRLGFPDVSWELYFDPAQDLADLDKRDLESFIRDLKARRQV